MQGLIAPSYTGTSWHRILLLCIRLDKSTDVATERLHPLAGHVLLDHEGRVVGHSTVALPNPRAIIASAKASVYRSSSVG